MKEEFENKPKYFWGLQIGTVILVSLVIGIFIIPDKEGASYFSYGFLVVLTLILIYWISARMIRPKSEGKTEQGNPYHSFFFRGTAILTTILIILGIIGAFFVYVEHDNLFQSVGLVTSIIWIGAFLMYFMWSVYHYNINYGITDQDWEKIFEAEERHKQGFPVKPSELDAPKNNPYRSQTFGLPPGTVRGMIAFTLLIGGMSLLIVSFGTEYTGAELALVRQQFEFFETAFLMMIAFYFGDKSLKYLQSRWRDPNRRSEKPETSSSETMGTSIEPQPVMAETPKDTVYYEDQEFLEEEEEFSDKNGMEPSSPLSPVKVPFSSATLKMEKGVEYVQIMDNLHRKVLSEEAIKEALEELKAVDKIELSLPVVKAIVAVESAGRGHLQDGKAKILFEGHKFWSWLQKSGKDPSTLQPGNENIIYKDWTNKNYLTGAAEYVRLEAAKIIDDKAAIYSASWGLFQILGENLDTFIKSRNYKDIYDFEEKQHESEYNHFLDFLAFIKTKKVRGKALIHYISEENKGNYDWATFAYGYNGSGYKVNQYDVKLKVAYEKYLVISYPGKSGWIPIIDAGHGGIVNGKYVTPGKYYKFNDGTTVFEGVINRAIGRLLADKLKIAGIPFYQSTLDTEDDISLTERVQQANAYYNVHRNCYFLSIHSNSSSNEVMGEGNKARGFEIYTSIGKTKSDELANIASKWYKKLFPDFVFRENKTDAGDFENKEEAFTVLSKTQCPAFLVENLFFDNKEEAQFLLSEMGQLRIADCLYQIVKEIYEKVRV